MPRIMPTEGGCPGPPDHEGEAIPQPRERVHAVPVKTRWFYRSRTVGQEVGMGSNGETALSYFEAKLKNDTLYCLDEPENSMSPKMQLELMDMLQEIARYCGCQLIIVTHSPFLLALDGARIYDLDASPVDIRNWWELENSKVYFDFFKRHEALFLKGCE